MALEVRVVDSTLEEALLEFFRDFRESGGEKYFHPHPFTDTEARNRAQYSGKDLYYVMRNGKKIIGYGMLRGWDEGYNIPSLGIMMHSSVRRKGLAKLFIDFLHAAAKLRGCRKIRLKVYPENSIAVAMYKKFGYSFQEDGEGGQIVGFIDL